MTDAAIVVDTTKKRFFFLTPLIFVLICLDKLDLNSETDLILFNHSRLVLIMYKDKGFSLWAEMRPQDAIYSIHLFGIVASLLELFRKPRRQTQYRHSLHLGLSKKKQICFLSCTIWVVVLKNTNASKGFFYRGVIAVLVPVVPDTVVYRTYEIRAQDARFVKYINQL